MDSNQTAEQALTAFYNLSDDNVAKLKDLNIRIQNHKGQWSTHMGGQKMPKGSIEMSWVQNDELILDFTRFVYDMGLIIIFDWQDWDEGEALYTSKDPTKYDTVSLQTVLKLITAVIRQDRFVDGSLAWAFESGNFPKLLNRLVALKDEQHA